MIFGIGNVCCVLSCYDSAVVVGSFPLDVVELLHIYGATSEVCWVFPSAVNAFWGGAGWFGAIFRGVLLVAFDALGGSTAVSR